MTHRRTLSIEKQRIRLKRIIDLRENYDLDWRQIGARVGFSATYCASIYRRHRPTRTKERIVKEFKESRLNCPDTPFNAVYKMLQKRQDLIMEMLQVLDKEIRKGR